jgi:hypothetical protein
MGSSDSKLDGSDIEVVQIPVKIVGNAHLRIQMRKLRRQLRANPAHGRNG